MQTPSRILVVDDKLELAETLADALVDRGFDAHALASSHEALAAIERGAVALLVTDLRMPGPDGLALLAAARSCAHDIPVIVMTAYGAIAASEDAIRRGACHCLLKPFKIDVLAGLVARALAERRAPR
jgi:DNA-binding NtrC family response regulator